MRSDFLTGLWRRLAIEYPDGSGDTTSEVYWLQAGDLYADLRIPAGRPQLPEPEQGSDVPVNDLHQLAEQQGFAGNIRLQGEQCTWYRWLDYQPVSATPDEGRLYGNGRMLVEYGIHQPYIEHWWHEDRGRDGYVGFRLQGSTAGVLLVVGEHFMRAVGQPYGVDGGTDSHGESAALPDCEISFGRRHGNAEEWLILRSTKPWLEGKRLFAGGDPLWGEYERHVIEPLEGGSKRTWELHESKGIQPRELFGDAA